MSELLLVLRSLRHGARARLGVLLGVALTAATLSAALVVGDSLEGSLLRLAEARLGSVTYALDSGDRAVRAELANELQAALGGPALAPLWRSPAVAIGEDGARRVNGVQLYGVDERFFRLAPSAGAAPKAPRDGLWLGSALAERLSAKLGDELLIRVPKAGKVSGELPLVAHEEDSQALRLEVTAVLPDERFGRFSLRPAQAPPLNAYMNLDALTRALDRRGRANLLLCGGAPSLDQLRGSLRRSWTLEDLQLELRALAPGGPLQLSSERVFLSPPLAAFARSAPAVTPILTYLVNELRVGERRVPYSFVACIDGAPSAQLGADQLRLGPWLRDALGAKPGDQLELSYSELSTQRRLIDRTAKLRVGAELPEGSLDRELSPKLPGLSDKGSCRDWDSSLPIDLERIKARDERYWERYGPTPKALMSLAAGQALFANRYGELTALRFDRPASDLGGVAKELRGALDPDDFGLSFRPMRAAARASAVEGIDFGGLFLGLSFFIIVTALALTALLFVFSIEQRSQELGALRALGFRARSVRRLVLTEGALIAFTGALLGAPCGPLFAGVVLSRLGDIWSGAVGSLPLSVIARPATLAIAAIAATLTALGALAIATRALLAGSPLALLSGQVDALSSASSKPRRSLIASAFAAAASIALTVIARDHAQPEPLYFGAGAALLGAGLLVARALLTGRRGELGRAPPANPLALALLGATRRPTRSLATIALLASGVFLVGALGAFQQDATRASDQRHSGTGGFSLFGESTLPLIVDLTSPEGRARYGLPERPAAGLEIVPVRVRDGDDASCLNLNRAREPRLLGLAPQQLARRRAFSIHAASKPPGEDPWLLLEQDPGELGGAIPAFVEANTAQWMLGVSLGDTVTVRDARGQARSLIIRGLVGTSVLQGHLIISERRFVALYPNEPGARMFLIDAPRQARKEIAARLTRALEDLGLELAPTELRLGELLAVQNTYLHIFQALSAIALLLGSLGLGIVITRNLLERRVELSVLGALGYSRRQLARLVYVEHAALLISGLILGLGCATLGAAPSLVSASADGPRARLLALGLGLCLFGLVSLSAATRLALRGDLVQRLRGD